MLILPLPLVVRDRLEQSGDASCWSQIGLSARSTLSTSITLLFDMHMLSLVLSPPNRLILHQPSNDFISLYCQPLLGWLIRADSNTVLVCLLMLHQWIVLILCC